MGEEEDNYYKEDDNSFYDLEFDLRAKEFGADDVIVKSEEYDSLPNINLLLAGLDSSITQDLKKFNSQLKEYFPTDWAGCIIDLYGSEKLDSTTIRLALESSKLPQSQIEIAAQHFEKTYNKLGPKSLELVKKRFMLLLNGAKLNYFLNNCQGNALEAVEGISKRGVIKIGDGLDEFRDIINEGSLLDFDLSKIKDLATSGIKSSFDFVNKSFVCNGWPDGSLVLITAPPGTGKTAFMLNEVGSFLEQGLDVVYCAIGDMGPSDFLIRMSASYYNVKLNHVVENAELYIRRYFHDFGHNLKRLHTLFIDPGVVMMSQLRTYFERKGYINDKTVVIIDYDMNLKAEESDAKKDSAFEQFRGIYNIAISMTRGDKRVKALFMLGQPKTESYDHLKPSLISAGCMSAAKIQICDIVASFSRDPEAPNVMGYFSILKCRRHGRVCSVPYILNMSGKVSSVDINTYNAIKTGGQVMTDSQEDKNNARIIEETKKMIVNNFRVQEEIEF